MSSSQAVQVPKHGRNAWLMPESASAGGPPGSTSCPSDSSSRAVASAAATHSGCVAVDSSAAVVSRPMRSLPGSAPTSWR
jgi:hypothetical protein